VVATTLPPYIESTDRNRRLNVPVPTLTTYFMVNVLEPAVRPATTRAALHVIALFCAPVTFGVVIESQMADAATVVAPEMSRPILDVAFALLFPRNADMNTNALVPDVTVADGPTVARSANVVDAVVSDTDAESFPTVRAARLFDPVDTNHCPAPVALAAAVSFRSPERVFSCAAVSAAPDVNVGGATHAIRRPLPS
jgi:hypothetical protein